MQPKNARHSPARLYSPGRTRLAENHYDLIDFLAPARRVIEGRLGGNIGPRVYLT
ncbi:MAG: hypothetical protein ACETWQ_03200 [Phycisphaerae bacterium]